MISTTSFGTIMDYFNYGFIFSIMFISLIYLVSLCSVYVQLELSESVNVEYNLRGWYHSEGEMPTF